MHLPALFPAWVSHLPLDWVFIVIFALLIAFDALRSGSGRAAVLALSLPIAEFLFGLLPKTMFLGKLISSLSNPMAQAGIFLVIFVVIYILAYRLVDTFANGSRGLLLAILSGISATIITVVIWLQEPALQAIWHFSPLVQNIFGAAYALFWLLGAYLMLAFVGS